MASKPATNNQGGEAEWEAELEKLLVYELGAFLSENAFLEAIPKEKGHHQGFSPTSVIEGNAKVIASRIAPIVAKAKKEAVGEAFNELARVMEERYTDNEEMVRIFRIVRKRFGLDGEKGEMK